MSASDTDIYLVNGCEDLMNAQESLERRFMAKPDIMLEVTVAKYVPKRSTLQNRLYWEYMTQLGDYTGHTKDEMSLFFKWKFLGAEKTEVYGQSFNAVKSTTDLNVKEFCEYLRNIEVFAAEQGFMFKLPAYYNDIWGRE